MQNVIFCVVQIFAALKTLNLCFQKYIRILVNVFVSPNTPLTQNINWTYIRRSEDVLDVFRTFYVRSIYVLCPLGTWRVIREIYLYDWKEQANIFFKTFRQALLLVQWLIAIWRLILNLFHGNVSLIKKPVNWFVF